MPVRILALDGGGGRGLVLVEQLRMMDSVLREFHSSLSEFFHFVAGTSTGGLCAAALLLRPDLGMAELHELYMDLAKEIFGEARGTPPWYDAAPLEALLKHHFGATSLAAHAAGPLQLLLVAADNSYAHMPAFGLSNRPLASFGEHAACDVPAWMAIRATTAAPTYFRSMPLDAERALIDGGVVANNPSMLAYREATKGQGRDVAVLVSLGTGDFTDKGGRSGNRAVQTLASVAVSAFFGGHYGEALELRGLAQHMVESMTAGDQVDEAMELGFDAKGRPADYLRLNPKIESVKLDETDPAVLKKMVDQCRADLVASNAEARFRALVARELGKR